MGVCLTRSQWVLVKAPAAPIERPKAAARRVSKEATPPSVRLRERKRELDAKVEDARKHLALLLKERADLEKHLNTGLEVEKALEAAAHC